MRRYSFLVLYAVVVVALMIVCRHLSITHDDILQSLNLIEGHVRAAPAEATVLFFASSALLAYFSFPAMPIVFIAAGYCLGTLPGTLAVLLGSTCGGLGTFLLFRKHIPPRFCRPYPGLSSAKMWLTLLGLRLSPIVPAPLVNFFAVFLDVPPVQFFATTLVGSAPLILFYQTMGDQGRGILHGQGADWRQTALYLAILCLSTLMSFLGPWRSFLTSVRHVKDDIVVAVSTTAKAAKVAKAAKLANAAKQNGTKAVANVSGS